jgi:hypothetical protein
MTDDIDRRLAGLLAAHSPEPDPAFADRVVALASFELTLRASRRRTIAQLVKEAAALGAVLLSFALLARTAPESAGFGDAVPLGSPAMLGVAVLALWALTGARSAKA